MTDKNVHEKIYVALLNEPVDVWRPVAAEKINHSVYRIAEQPYDREDEKWQFEPGSIVYCETITLSGKQVLAAKRHA